MSLFQCSKCGCVENTALSGYHVQKLNAYEAGVEFIPVCSACNPEIRKWHGQFEQKPATGYLIDVRGFLWSGHEHGPFPFAMVGILVGMGQIYTDNAKQVNSLMQNGVKEVCVCGIEDRNHGRENHGFVSLYDYTLDALKSEALQSAAIDMETPK